MAAMTLSMMEVESHNDDSWPEWAVSTTTADSYPEELEAPTENPEEKIERNPVRKEETEDSLETAEENLPNEKTVENDKNEMEMETEEISPHSSPEKISDPENLEMLSPSDSLEMLSSSSEDTTGEILSDDKKTEMIMLPFKADEENGNIEKSEMMRVSEDEKKEEEPIKKPKKSRKQEIVIMSDMENVRGIIPDYDTSVVYEIISQLPIIRRCIIEHSYFKNELYNSNLYDLSDLLRNDPNKTLPIENKRAPETIDCEYLSSASLDTSSDPSDLLQQSTRSSVESELNYGDLTDSEDEGFDIFGMPKIRQFKLVSPQVTTDETKKIPILPKPPKLIKIGEHQSVSWDDIDKELSEMETMIKKRKEEMPGLTRIVRARNVDIPFQVSNLKKTGDIKNSDIDEILARVSEMNAKNLTKALEREKFKEESTSPGDSPSKIKVKSVENINEELIKKELEHRLVKPNFNAKIVNSKQVLVPLPNELSKPGTYYRLLNPGAPGKVFQITNKGRQVKPRNPGKLFPNRPMNPYRKLIPDKPPEKPVFPVKSIEQKIVPPPTNTRFVKLVPYEPEKLKLEAKKPEVTIKPEPVRKPDTSTKADKTEVKKQVSLYAFSNILKTILPENWMVTMDPRYGLQILKTQMDGQLNPFLVLSLVVGRCGKIRINVRGRQLDKSHEIFCNIGTVANSEGKVSVFYVLSLIEKLKMYSVCCGCDDPTLQEYWTEDGATECYTELLKTFRSHSCELLVHLNKKRCYACHRLHEKLKKRQRRDQLEKKGSAAPDLTTNEIKEISEVEKRLEIPPLEKSLKRNLEEEFLEESFSSIKRQITDEIEKRRVDTEEKVPKTQEEVLSFMGLARKDTLEQNSVRKSKREKKNFNKFEPNDMNVSQMELDFLEKYWDDINTLFSTSMLFGAYSRTGSGRLRTKCMIFHKILKKWQKIIRDNPDWIGSDLVIYDQTLDRNETSEQIFRNMNIEDLRKYLMNAVKEVGKVKSRLKTKNSYFKCLYNKYVKRRAKRQKKEQAENSMVDNTDESSREKDDKFLPDNSRNHEIFMEYVSDGE